MFGLVGANLGTPPKATIADAGNIGGNVLGFTWSLDSSCRGNAYYCEVWMSTDDITYPNSNGTTGVVNQNSYVNRTSDPIMNYSDWGGGIYWVKFKVVYQVNGLKSALSDAGFLIL